MKKLFLLSISFLLLNCGLTPSLMQSNPIEKVFKLEGQNKSDLYVKANQWMVNSFNNAKSVIQFSDKESGTITGKYMLGKLTASDRFNPGTEAYAIVNIQVKDGASKVTITPESFKYYKGNPYSLYSEEKAIKDINALFDSFEKYMNTKNNNDW